LAREKALEGLRPATRPTYAGANMVRPYGFGNGKLPLLGVKIGKDGELKAL
jgi:hypothetical protein